MRRDAFGAEQKSSCANVLVVDTRSGEADMRYDGKVGSKEDARYA